MNKEINLNHMPIIDWDLAIKVAGHQKELAEELLSMLMKTLPSEMKTIKELTIAKKYPELRKEVHKLHGAICYCGLPRLKRLIVCLETDLKNNIMINLPSVLVQLEKEVNLLLEQRFSHHSF